MNISKNNFPIILQFTFQLIYQNIIYDAHIQNLNNYVLFACKNTTISFHVDLLKITKSGLSDNVPQPYELKFSHFLAAKHVSMEIN